MLNRHHLRTGRCIGSYVGSQTLDDAKACLEACQANEFCGWFTYHTSDQDCLLTADCAIRDESCGDCVHGQVYCEAGDDPPPGTGEGFYVYLEE